MHFATYLAVLFIAQSALAFDPTWTDTCSSAFSMACPSGFTEASRKASTFTVSTNDYEVCGIICTCDSGCGCTDADGVENAFITSSFQGKNTTASPATVTSSEKDDILDKMSIAYEEFKDDYRNTQSETKVAALTTSNCDPSSRLRSRALGASMAVGSIGGKGNCERNSDDNFEFKVANFDKYKAPPGMKYEAIDPEAYLLPDSDLRDAIEPIASTWRSSCTTCSVPAWSSGGDIMSRRRTAFCDTKHRRRRQVGDPTSSSCTAKYYYRVFDDSKCRANYPVTGVKVAVMYLVVPTCTSTSSTGCDEAKDHQQGFCHFQVAHTAFVKDSATCNSSTPMVETMVETSAHSTTGDALGQDGQEALPVDYSGRTLNANGLYGRSNCEKLIPVVDTWARNKYAAARLDLMKAATACS